MKKQIKKLLSSRYLLPLCNIISPLYSGNGSILMFHRVIADDDNLICEDIEVKESFLEESIVYFIENNYSIVSLNEAYEIISGKNIIEKKFVVFTFDDGYIDNYTIAYPLFKKYNIPFTIYVTSSFPNNSAKLWWYGLKDLTQENTVISFNYKGKLHTYSTKISREKEKAYQEIRNLILSVSDKELDELLENIFKPYGINLQTYVESLSMTWNQISELSNDNLVTIGSHTDNHYNLRNLEYSKVKEEILTAKYLLEKKTGKEVQHFAYPFGSRNEARSREFEIASTLGLKTATTTRCSNIFKQHSTHLNSLPRLTVSPYTESSNIEYYSSGLIPALRNKLKRFITD